MPLRAAVAGFFLKTHGSLVKGLMPLRAAVAGFFLSLRFKTPPSLKTWCFFNSEAASSMRVVTTALTSLLLTPVFSATVANAAVAVMAPPAFMAFFMDFMAGAIALRIAVMSCDELGR